MWFRLLPNSGQMKVRPLCFVCVRVLAGFVRQTTSKMYERRSAVCTHWWCWRRGLHAKYQRHIEETLLNLTKLLHNRITKTQRRHGNVELFYLTSRVRANKKNINGTHTHTRWVVPTQRYVPFCPREPWLPHRPCASSLREMSSSIYVKSLL